MKGMTFTSAAVLIMMAIAPVRGTPRAGQALSVPTKRPNIIWISNEDMSPRLGAYGDALARTPVLDRLAKESIRFTHAFTPAPS